MEIQRYSAERLSLLPRLPRDDPRAAIEIIDTHQSAAQYALSVGALPAMLEALRLAEGDDLIGRHAGLSATLQVVPLTLTGDLTGALREAAVAWAGTAEGAEPYVSGWLSGAILAAALAAGLLCDQAGWQCWRGRAARLFAGWPTAERNSASFAVFVDARVALATGAFRDAPRLVDRAFGEFVHYRTAAYAHAAAAELAVAAGLPQADRLLEVVAADAEQNLWARAARLRSIGRLNGDLGALADAARAWESIGAQYERAATLLLIPDRAAEGRAELDAIGVSR
jgi:hypothetical protein